MNTGLKKTLLCLLLQCIVVTGFAITAKADAVENCWSSAGDHYGIDPWLLYAIASVESDHDPSAVNRNTNGSEDIGLMQINSRWFPLLNSLGYARHDLFDPCINITVGAWVLAESRALYGNNWRAVGAYNAGTGSSLQAERRRFVYARRVLRRYHMFSDKLHSDPP